MSADTLFAWGCQRYPAVAGFKARQTSRDAARAIAPKARQLQTRVVAALEQFGPMTADETAAKLGESVLSIRPRFTELSTDEPRFRAVFGPAKIADSGLRRRNRSGRNAIVWRALP